MVRVCSIALALAVALPASAQPQQFTLDIQNGLVTMSATNVPVRQVLAEWAKVGGTRVVGAERITGPALTLRFEGVPEAQALDIVLRGAAGYMAAERSVPGSGRSRYDRILVLASSTPPASPAANAAAGAGANRQPGSNRFGVPPVAEPPEAQEVEVDMAQVPEAPQVNPFANAFGQPGMPGQFGQPAQANPFGQPAAPAPFGQPFQQPQPGAFFQPLQPQPTAPAQGFFGVVGSATPGLVQQPIQQPAQPPAVPPGVRPRPQG